MSASAEQTTGKKPVYRRRWFTRMVMISLVIIAGYFVWDHFYPSATFRYRITVNVETPEGLKSGSAVREVTVKMAPEIQGLSGTRAFVKGEAVVVDLDERGVLFALMRGFKNSYDHDYQVMFSAFLGPPGFTREGVEYYSHLKNKETVLQVADYPMMVAFADLDDQDSVKSVYEVKADTISRPQYRVIADRFEDQFGKGVKLRDITVETTNDPVTWVVSKYLSQFSAWLQRGGTISGKITFKSPPPLEETLIPTDFIKR